MQRRYWRDIYYGIQISVERDTFSPQNWIGTS